MNSDVDHLVYAAPDLSEAIGSVEHLLGCSVVPGGRHRDWGTRNALVSLGDATYLEIIGPDSESTIDGPPTLFGIDRLDEPRIVTWAAKGSNLSGIIASARRAGVDLGSVSGGRRALPDGSTLAWQLTDPFADRVGGVVPFFIDWGASSHPARSLPPTCELLTLEVEHPDPERVLAAMAALDVALDVVAAPGIRITATIQTPRGVVTLT
jgi:hypothetical protein